MEGRVAPNVNNQRQTLEVCPADVSSASSLELCPRNVCTKEDFAHRTSNYSSSPVRSCGFYIFVVFIFAFARPLARSLPLVCPNDNLMTQSFGGSVLMIQTTERASDILPTPQELLVFHQLFFFPLSRTLTLLGRGQAKRERRRHKSER